MSGGTLVVAEHRRGGAREISFELITAALEVKGRNEEPLTVLVVGADDGLAGSLGPDGVDEVLRVETVSPAFDSHVTERALLAAIDRCDPSLVLAGHTVDGFGFAPAAAARQRLGFASNVTAVHAGDEGCTAERGVYGDRLVAALEFEPGTVLLMVRPGAYPAAPASVAAPVSALAVDPAEPQSTHHGFREAPAGAVDITKSEVLLSIGRGIGDRENVERFASLAERMGATLSASRPLVDAGWVEGARQVGQSGRTVKPAVYLAFGISGAVQHLAGIRDAGVVVAINADPDAPIFAVADYGAVLDVHDVASALEQRM